MHSMQGNVSQQFNQIINDVMWCDVYVCMCVHNRSRQHMCVACHYCLCWICSICTSHCITSNCFWQICGSYSIYIYILTKLFDILLYANKKLSYNNNIIIIYCYWELQTHKHIHTHIYIYTFILSLSSFFMRRVNWFILNYQHWRSKENKNKTKKHTLSNKGSMLLLLLLLLLLLIDQSFGSSAKFCQLYTLYK